MPYIKLKQIDIDKLEKIKDRVYQNAHTTDDVLWLIDKLEEAEKKDKDA